MKNKKKKKSANNNAAAALGKTTETTLYAQTQIPMLHSLLYVYSCYI